MCVCFIGHRSIEKTEELRAALRATILMLIQQGVTDFLFGDRSEFNDLSWEVVTTLKEEYPMIKRIYVRAVYSCIGEAYKKYLLQFYEETYCPSNLTNAGKCAYIKRNYEIIDNSSYCVFYYNERYTPILKQRVKSEWLNSSKRNSGTKIAYEYAIKKKKQIINLYKPPSMLK